MSQTFMSPGKEHEHTALAIVVCGYVTAPLALGEWWIAGYAAAIAMLPVLVLLVARPGSIRPTIVVAAPAALMGATCLDLLQPIVFAPTGHHGPYGTIPPHVVLPAAMGGLAWLLGTTAEPWKAQRLAPAVACLVVLMACVVGHATSRQARSVAGVVALSPIVARVEARHPLPVVTDGDHPIDLARVERDVCAARLAGPNCEKEPTSWLSEETTRGETLVVRRLTSGWLVYRPETPSDAFDAKSWHAVALRADGTTTSLRTGHLASAIAAPRAWSIVAWLGAAAGLIGVCVSLGRARPFAWMLRTTTVEHSGFGHAEHPELGVGQVDPAWPPGPLAVRVAAQASNPYRSAWTASHVAQGTADEVRVRFIEGLAADLTACGLVVAITAAPAFTGALAGRILVVPW